MEQFFVIIAIVVFWIFRGVAGNAQRRVPGQDPYEDGPLGPGGSIDSAGSTRQKTLEGQQRAIEALQRWEEKQRLAGGYGGPARGGPEAVPAASRTRAGRPARIAGRTTAERKRRQAYADIAQMLDPQGPTDSTSSSRRRFEVEQQAAQAGLAEAVPTPERASKPRSVPNEPRQRAPRRARPATKAKLAPKQGSHEEQDPAAAALARLERLPLAARAIVYSEILGPPRSLS